MASSKFLISQISMYFWLILLPRFRILNKLGVVFGSRLIPYNFAPSSFKVNASQEPTKPDEPVIRIFLFL